MVRVATETPRARIVTEFERSSGTPRPSPELVGSIARMAGPAVALNILQGGMKGAMLGGLAMLQQPRPDLRSASRYLSDRTTTRSIRVLEPLNKDLRPFGRDFAQRHAGVIANANIRVMMLATSRSRSIEERLVSMSSPSTPARSP